MSESQAQNKSKLVSLPTDRRKSPCFPVPDYMYDPEKGGHIQVYHIYGHQIRRWRTHLKASEDRGIHPFSGLIEWTDLKTGLTLGLEWAYSTYQKPEWKHIKYQLYGHFPGEQPCKDLQDVYDSTTRESNWVIETIKREYEQRTRPKLMVEEPQGVFPQ